MNIIVILYSKYYTLWSLQDINNQNYHIMTKISIILIFYNDAKYLAKSIESLLNQTYKTFELIMLDNGSSDGSYDIAHKYEQQDSRIKIIRAKDNYHNIASNFKKLLDLSTGQYVKFFCADDIMLPNCLSQQFEILQKNKKYIACFANMQYIDDNGKTLKQSYNSIVKNNRYEYLNHIFYSYQSFAFPTAMIKKSVLTNKMLDPRLMHFFDVKLWINLLKQGEIFVINEKLVEYRLRKNQGNVSNISENNKRLRSYIFEVHLLYSEFFQISNISQYLKIFPETKNYIEKIDPKNDQDLLPFITAILLYNSDNFKPFHFSLHRNIALLKIFEIIQNETIMSKIEEKFGFDHLLLYKLTSNFCEGLDLNYSRKKRSLLCKLWYKLVTRRKYKKLALKNRIDLL